MYLCRRNERDEERFYSVAHECDAGRLYGPVRTTDYAQRSGHRVVSHALYELHSAGVHRIASCRLAEIPAVVRMWNGSIKASNVSIGVICFSLIGFFTALFEPMIFKKRFSGWELLFSLITVAGVMCIFSLDARYRYGIMIGVVSSAVCALYAICNKKASVGIRSRMVLMYQMSGGLVVVSAIIPVYLWFFPSQQPVVVIPDGTNLWFMLCHALFCTVGMYLLQIQALKRLSAFTVNLTYNLEPCYTIILAFLIFGEGREINFSFYLGIALILLSVLLQSMKAWKR